MKKKTILLFICLFSTLAMFAQAIVEKPVITYSLNDNKKYTIADIKITGIESYSYDDQVLIKISGLSIGDKVNVPGKELSDALKAFLKHGLFSWGQILATKQTADSVWIEINLSPNPLISNIDFQGVNESEKNDLETKIGIICGSQLTPNVIEQTKKQVKIFFNEKGFNNAEVTIRPKINMLNNGKVIMEIIVNRNQKITIQNIFINGNKQLSDNELKLIMKKTNEEFSFKKHQKLSLLKFFSTKKFIRDEFEKDLNNIIVRYNEKGYRNANIAMDSVVLIDKQHVNIYITVDEGDKYYIKSINWVGNTIYSSDKLNSILGMQPGDVYNQKQLNNRLVTDEDAITNLYYNNGYIFSQIVPVETHIKSDSVDIEVRIQEGVQAILNKVVINGNNRVYENVIRRELVTKPGQLFSKEALMRSAREISQMGHFDSENMNIQPIPDEEAGTVDIYYNLTSKANDQIEFSVGWGQSGIIGRLSLKFSNFSCSNLIHPKTYSGLIPQGEGQTLTLSGQTNGQYYQSYSISFLDPWFGSKRPNHLSVSSYYMMQTGIDQHNYINEYVKTLNISTGYGKRLCWPDNYFTVIGELAYQHYWLKNWPHFVVPNGSSNSLTFGMILSRNSTDNPRYTRSGSFLSLSVTATPPYSLWDNINYGEIEISDSRMYNWIEYHKWKFQSKIFIPLTNSDKMKRTPVLMSRIEYGFLGTYNSKKHNPFETFYMGGSGMTGYSTMYATEIIALRGYSNGALTPHGREGYAYTRLGLELRYPFILEQTSTIYGLAFIEAGNAWSDIRTFNPFAIKRSAGFGIRIFLPMIGLIGIDQSYGFDQPVKGANISGPQFSFILGQEF